MSIEIFENTLLKIINRQGTDVDRKNIVLESGELGYTIDTERLFVGNGSDEGGVLVGNKYKGKSSIITNLTPCEIGDLGFATTTNSLYVLDSGDGSNINDWLLVAYPTETNPDSPLSFDNDGRLDLSVESPLFVEDNTLKFGVNSTSPIIFDNDGRLDLSVESPLFVEDNTLKFGGIDTPFLSAGEIIDLIYPINSVYISFSDLNPNSNFPNTTWAQISQGRYLAGVGTGTDINSTTKTISVGNNSGEYEHQLTINELPSHSHEFEALQKINAQPPTDLGVETDNTNRPATRNRRTEKLRLYTSENSGGDLPHNNTPPSFGLYIWRRTS